MCKQPCEGTEFHFVSRSKNKKVASVVFYTRVSFTWAVCRNRGINVGKTKRKQSPKAMDEREFRRLLDLFPVVRSRNFCAGSELLRGSTSHSTRDERAQGEGGLNEVVSKDGSTEIANDDLFWQKLWVAAEKKVGATKAEKFCEAFRKAHERLVYKELSLAAVRKFVN